MEKKRCKKCNNIVSAGAKKCSECGGKEWTSVLYSDNEVAKYFPGIPKKGLWYEVIDFSDEDAYWSNDWGFYGFDDGHMIYNSGNIASKARGAGEEARRWKMDEIEKRQKARLDQIHKQTAFSLRSK